MTRALLTKLAGAIAFCALLAITTTCGQPVTHPSPTTDVRRMLRENVSVMDGTTAVLRFEPPPIYAMWRAEVEQCAGRSRPGTPTFWVAPVLQLNASGAIGMYIRPQRRIVFGLGFETVSWVVRHELLHDLLDIAHGDTHPVEYFREKCVALVWAPTAFGTGASR